MNELSLPPSDREVVLFPCNELLRGEFLRVREAGRLSNSQIARKLGVSSTAVSMYCNDAGNKYAGDTAALERRIEDFLRNESRRRASGVATAKCGVSAEVTAACEFIRKTAGVGEIFAESGEGKTRAIELYLHDNPTAIAIRVKTWARDVSSVMAALFDAVGHAGYDGYTKRMEFICTKLRGTGRLLIVDDAHKLTKPALQCLFDLHDETACPVALVGTPALAAVLEADTQRSSRVGLAFSVAGDNPRALVRHMVKELVQDANGEEAELVDLAESTALEHGHFRSVHQQLKLAVELHEAKKGLPWTKAWEQAATFMPSRKAQKAMVRA